MEGFAKLKVLRKAFCSHLTCIYGKIEKLDVNKKDEENYYSCFMNQLQRKAESIGSLDMKIVAEIESPEDLE